MGIRITVEGGLPSRVWDAQASRQLGIVALSAIQSRTFDRGQGLNDIAHKPYSEAYAAFRARKRYQVSPPNLTRTGRLRRSLRVKWATRQGAGIGLTGDPAVYGTFVGRDRPFLGLSARDRTIVQRGMPRLIEAAIRRSIRRVG